MEAVVLQAPSLGKFYETLRQTNGEVEEVYCCFGGKYTRHGCGITTCHMLALA